jgi:quinol monooxygenase YgiN
MRKDTLRVVARIKALPDKVDAVRSILIELIEPTREEQGCLVYELLQNKSDPTDFTFIEEWEGNPSLNSHAASDHMKSVGAKLRDVLAAPTDIRRYSVVK